jgi:hypothetical protein
MLTECEQWQAGRERGLIWVNVPSLKWTRVSHDWELWRIRDYLRHEKQIPVETRLAIFAWLEQVEAVVDAQRDDAIRLAATPAEHVCNAMLVMTVLGLIVCGFLLAGGVL